MLPVVIDIRTPVGRIKKSFDYLAMNGQCVVAHLLTPRLSRCAAMSSLHANRGTICDPVPSKLQAESGELNEQVKVTFILPTATSAELDQCKELTTAVCRW